MPKQSFTIRDITLEIDYALLTGTVAATLWGEGKSLALNQSDFMRTIYPALKAKLEAEGIEVSCHTR